MRVYAIDVWFNLIRRSTMDLQAATPEQIDAFYKGAEARFTERRVAPPVAQQLFGMFMNKTAAEMGFMPAAAAGQVDAMATKIANALGRKRKV
jgi:hypothetical protein